MSTPISREEFDLLRKLIEQGFEGTHFRLDKVNSRIDKLEDFKSAAIADIATLEERTGGAEGTATNAKRNATGGIVISILAIILGALKFFLQ